MNQNSCNNACGSSRRALQAAADAIPTRRVRGSDTSDSCDCNTCGCSNNCGCNNCGCNNCGCNNCGCNNCGCNNCGCSNRGRSNCGCSNCGCSNCGCNCRNCDDDDDDDHREDGECAAARYYGFPEQTVASGGLLSMRRYFPASDGDDVVSIPLPRGRYQISYSVNASVTLPGPIGSGTTVTVGIAPQLNGTTFSRGGSFATLAYNGEDTFSTTLSSTFVVSLEQAINTLSFTSTTESTFTTRFELLNIVISKVC